MRKAPKLALLTTGLVAITFVTTSFNYSSTPVVEAKPIQKTVEVNYSLLEAQEAGRYQADQDAISAFLADQEQKRVQAEKAKAEAEAKAKAKAARVTKPVVVQQYAANGQIPPLLARIRDCESGDYTAVNRGGSTASGAYQILDSTWRGKNNQGGWRELVPGGINYARAKDAPPEIQDAVALAAFNAGGSGPWAASRGCWSR